MAMTGPAAGLFDVVARLQGREPWGSFLDAGTGVQSARWASALPTARWTAVSADAGHLAEVRAAVAGALRPHDRLIVGNWADPSLLAGEVHDTVLADYLLGAVEGYAPYFQDRLFMRLRPHVGRRLYVIGVDPYTTAAPDEGAGRLVQDIGRLRDACALLAAQVPYREYPAEWVMGRLEEAGLAILAAQRFANRYGLAWIDRQMADVRALLGLVEDRDLAAALEARARLLRERAAALCRRDGWIAHGHNHLIAAAPR